MWCYKVYFFLPGHVIVTVLSSQTSCVMCFWVCTNLLFCEKVKIFSTKEREKEKLSKTEDFPVFKWFPSDIREITFLRVLLKKKKTIFIWFIPIFSLRILIFNFIFLISIFIHNNSSTRCKSCASRSTRKNFIIKQQFHIIMTCRSP